MVANIRHALRAQRTEVVVALVLMVIVILSAAIATFHLAAANPSEACWSRHWDGLETGFGDEPGGACPAQWRLFFDLRSEEAQKTIGLAAFLPFAVGLLLGVPLAARAATRAGGQGGGAPLGVRVAVMLALLVAGLGATAVVMAGLLEAANPWSHLGPGRLPSLDELTVEPLSFVARGIMAFGIGCLAGALLRRPLPAYAAGTAVLALLLGLAAPALHAFVADRVAVWQDLVRLEDGCDEPPSLYHFGPARFRTPDGSLLDADSPETALSASDPGCVTEEGMALAVRVAPIGSYRTFEQAEAIAWGSIGLLALLAAARLLRRRDTTRG